MRTARIITFLDFTTIFATAKDPTIFADRHTFDHGLANDVTDNCAAATALNDKSISVDGLSQKKLVGLITLGGDNHKPTHIGTETILIRDHNEKMHDIKIPKYLCVSTVTGECSKCWKIKSKLWCWRLHSRL